MRSTQARANTAAADRQSLEQKEILGFPARFLLDLPLKTTLVLRVPGIDDAVIWTTHNLERPRQLSRPMVFDRDEILALVSASESERAWPKDLIDWCRMKFVDADFVIDRKAVLCGAQPIVDRYWKVEQILRWFEVDLVSVTVTDSFETGNLSVAEAA